MDINVVIIDDNHKIKDDSLIWELNDLFGERNVHFFHKPKNGIEFIKSNLDKNIIVLLDIDFPENEMSGHDLLPEITNLSKLLPVILWSGIDENKETFSDFINNGAFGFISKMATSDEALDIITKAVSFFENSLANVIEDWIIRKDEDKNKIVYFTADGKSYSLNDILHEIRIQTEVGKSFSTKLNKLTIDLLLRKKENLDD